MNPNTANYLAELQSAGKTIESLVGDCYARKAVSTRAGRMKYSSNVLEVLSCGFNGNAAVSLLIESVRNQKQDSGAGADQLAAFVGFLSFAVEQLLTQGTSGADIIDALRFCAFHHLELLNKLALQVPNNLWDQQLLEKCQCIGPEDFYPCCIWKLARGLDVPQYCNTGQQLSPAMAAAVQVVHSLKGSDLGTLKWRVRKSVNVVKVGGSSGTSLSLDCSLYDGVLLPCSSEIISIISDCSGRNDTRHVAVVFGNIEVADTGSELAQLVAPKLVYDTNSNLPFSDWLRAAEEENFNSINELVSKLKKLKLGIVIVSGSVPENLYLECLRKDIFLLQNVPRRAAEQLVDATNALPLDSLWYITPDALGACKVVGTVFDGFQVNQASRMVLVTPLNSKSEIRGITIVVRGPAPLLVDEAIQMFWKHTWQLCDIRIRGELLPGNWYSECKAVEYLEQKISQQSYPKETHKHVVSWYACCLKELWMCDQTNQGIQYARFATMWKAKMTSILKHQSTHKIQYESIQAKIQMVQSAFAILHQVLLLREW